MSDLSPRLEEAFGRLTPWIRSHFPQIETLRNGSRRIYMDNAAGTLIPETAAAAMAEAALWSNPQPDRSWPAARAAGRAIYEARDLLREFLNAPAEDPIFLSESSTASLFKLRDALEPAWQPTSRILVTDCDHFANVSPWEWRAEGRWEVNRIRMAPDGTLDLDSLAGLLSSRVRLVALSAASNGLGTRIALEKAIPLIRSVVPTSWVVVDAVHGAPHFPLDVAALGADALALSTYKLFGPVCGVLWIRRSRLPELQPYHVAPHDDPETGLEWGTLNPVTVAGIRAALEYLLRLGERLEPVCVGRWTTYDRRRRLFKLALEGIRAYEAGLSRQVLTGLRDVPALELYGIGDPDRVRERAPTFAFAGGGMADPVWEQELWVRGGIQAACGNHYAGSLLRGLGRQGAVRASLAHYNTSDEVAFLLRVLTDLCTSTARR